MEEPTLVLAKGAVMSWRTNDVLVGVITGVFAAVVASAFEAFFIAERVLTIGAHGGGLGSKILFIAIVGGVVGGLVGFFLGALLKPRSNAQ